MTAARFISLVPFLFVCVAACNTHHTKSDLATPIAEASENNTETDIDVEQARSKIKFNLEAIDENGLIGPADGKRSLSYEFKIPDTEKHTAEVQKIDPGIKFMRGSRGRVGAGPGEVLCIGDTHKPGYREILLELASRPYIDRIIECHFE